MTQAGSSQEEGRQSQAQMELGICEMSAAPPFKIRPESCTWAAKERTATKASRAPCLRWISFNLVGRRGKKKTKTNCRKEGLCYSLNT